MFSKTVVKNSFKKHEPNKPKVFFCFCFCFLPVVIRADLIAAGVQVGCMELRRATMPETWGQAMDVPDSILKLSRGNSF